MGIIPTKGETQGKGMESGELIKRLQADGWIIRKSRGKKATGSLVTMTKPEVAKIITIPHPKKDPSKGILRQVQQISGLKLI
jgi:predicted RNA binding protein YcfA (HicA-like mRNA interferase family)